MHHYIYDANGERVLKSSSNFIQVEENGTVLDQEVTFDNYTTYASPQIVIDANNNYTKHYFEGSTRIVTRLGGNASIFEVEGGPGNKPAPNIKGQTKRFDVKEIQEGQISDLNYYFSLSTQGTKPSFKPFKKSISTNEDDKLELQNILQKQNDGFIEPKQNQEATAIFYYHADHLGSNEVISNDTGKPHEFHLTLPFGETMAEQRKPVANYYNSWKFTGKELDEETGLYYFGARYYQPSWSVWLSVDPLAEDYQSWSPYNYTMNNPIMLIDPDGRKIEYHADNSLWFNLGVKFRIFIKSIFGTKETRHMINQLKVSDNVHLIKETTDTDLKSNTVPKSVEDYEADALEDPTLNMPEFDAPEEEKQAYKKREQEYLDNKPTKHKDGKPGDGSYVSLDYTQNKGKKVSYKYNKFTLLFHELFHSKRIDDGETKDRQTEEVKAVQFINRNFRNKENRRETYESWNIPVED